MKVVIIGCGFVGLPLGAELVRRGHEVVGVRRDASRAAEIAAAGIRPVFADITLETDLEKVPRDADWVINCASAGGGGADRYYALYVEGNRNLLRLFDSPRLKRFVYTSSTGVYGQDDGSAVTETDQTVPGPDTSRALVEAERLLIDASKERSFPAVILRLAGIYGGGRGYWLNEVIRGRARIEGTGERWLNMIHRDDVVGATIAVLEAEQVLPVYNVVDNEPVQQRTLIEWLANQLGMGLPHEHIARMLDIALAQDTFEKRKETGSPPLSGGGEVASRARRTATNKRVLNSRLIELGYKFKFATYREGHRAELRRIVAGGKG